MDFGELISQSYKIAIKRKILWIFGVVAAISGGGPQLLNFPGNFNYKLSGEEVMTKDAEEVFSSLSFLQNIDSSTWALFITAAVVVVLALIFLFIYLQTWSYAGLVSQTLKITEGKNPSFSEGKNVGEKFFWKILSFRLLLGLAVIPGILLLAIPPLLFFVAGLGVYAIIFTVLSILVFIIGIFAYAIAASIISELGLRKMIEADIGVVQAIKQGVVFFRNNLGKSILVWLVNAVLGSVFIFPFLLISVVFFTIGMVLYSIEIWLVVFAILGFLISLSFVGGLWSVFIASYWSLAYRQITKGGD